MRRSIPLALLAGSALALAGCAGQPAASDDDTGAGLSLVASTDVYGDIASTIGGDLVEVTSIISGAAQDPHSYEASARDQLTLSEADVVVYNGGGYDPFIESLLSAAGTDPVVVTAVDASGLLDDDHAHAHEGEEDHAHEGEDNHAHEETETEEDHAHDEAEAGHEGHDHVEGFNEHVWYSPHAVEHIAEEIAHALGEADPDNAETYDANAEAFAADVATLEQQAEEIATSLGGGTVAVTEPVALYLLDEVGLENVTPDDFTEAVEEGADVSPAALQETLDLFTDSELRLLAYNEQTAGAETERVRQAAEDAGVPVVSFAETLPDGEDYVSWMTANLEAISAAVEQ